MIRLSDLFALPRSAAGIPRVEMVGVSFAPAKYKQIFVVGQGAEQPTPKIHARLLRAGAKRILEVFSSKMLGE